MTTDHQQTLQAALSPTTKRHLQIAVDVTNKVVYKTKK